MTKGLGCWRRLNHINGRAAVVSRVLDRAQSYGFDTSRARTG